MLGNEEPEASLPGEIRTRRDFYDYEAKYVDESTELLVPAPLSESESDVVRDLAIRAYRALEGAGLGRVDFLMERTYGRVLPERAEQPARLHRGVDVPAPLGSERPALPAATRPADRAGDRAPPPRTALETTFRRF